MPLLDWAMAQGNLGNALARLGERDNSDRLEEAVACYRGALGVCTRERAPMQWAMTRSNLACALLRLGERNEDTAQLELAVATYNDAFAVFIVSGATYYIEACWENRDHAIALIARLHSAAAPLGESEIPGVVPGIAAIADKPLFGGL